MEWPSKGDNERATIALESQGATVSQEPWRLFGKALGILAGMNGIGSFSTYTVQSVDIAHLIQIALTPIFLISAIGVTLNVLTNRLTRMLEPAPPIDALFLPPHHPHN